MDTIELKRLRGSVQHGIDEAFDQFSRRAESWAGYVRLAVGAIFIIAASILKQHGFDNVEDSLGSMAACSAVGCPIVK